MSRQRHPWSHFFLGNFLLAPCLCLTSFGVALSHAAGSNPLQLRSPTPLYAGSTMLQPGTYAIPCVVDWNGDGKKDLLVGYRTADKIALYLNSGTDSNPVFTNYTNLQTNGVDIIVPGAPSCGAPSPWVCDYDNDGKQDLLVGSGANSSIWFFRNTNSNPSDPTPKLAPGVQLSIPSTVTSRATPYVHDWDEDGLPDLFSGDMSGTVHYFRNSGTRSAAVYTNEVLLLAGGTTLNLGTRSVIRVFDWDGDGLKDLVGSSYDGVFWCRNTNSNADPKLMARVALQAPISTGGLANIVPPTNGRMRLHLVDWNNDGAMDLLTGNADGTVSYYEAYRFSLNASRLSTGLVLQWNSANYLKYNILAGPSFTNIAVIISTNIPSAGSITSYTNTPSDPARFFRVQIAP